MPLTNGSKHIFSYEFSEAVSQTSGPSLAAGRDGKGALAIDHRITEGGTSESYCR
jgi:hypothetical protein